MFNSSLRVASRTSLLRGPKSIPRSLRGFVLERRKRDSVPGNELRLRVAHDQQHKVAVAGYRFHLVQNDVARAVTYTKLIVSALYRLELKVSVRQNVRFLFDRILLPGGSAVQQFNIHAFPQEARRSNDLPPDFARARSRGLSYRDLRSANQWCKKESEDVVSKRSAHFPVSEGSRSDRLPVDPEPLVRPSILAVTFRAVLGR